MPSGTSCNSQNDYVYFGAKGSAGKDEVFGATTKGIPVYVHKKFADSNRIRVQKQEINLRNG
jgi:hypothetical protein